MRQTEYQQLQKGSVVFPIKDLFRKYPEYRGCVFVVVGKPTKEVFPMPLKLGIRKGRVWFRRLELWSGAWFKIKR